MPNLLLTNVCDYGCPFCFAPFEGNARYFQLEELGELLPFLRSFERDAINLLGGEPTCHPQFLPILRFLLREGFEVGVFSHGRIPERTVAQLQNVHEGTFTFCVNRSIGRVNSELELLYRKMGHLVQLGVTVHEPDQDLSYVIDEIQAYRLLPSVRIGIAVPKWPGARNVYLAPSDYPVAAQHLFGFVMHALKRGVAVAFDCGFPRCFFSETQREALGEHGIEFVARCGPIPDIGPGGEAIPCLPLSVFSQSVSAKSTWADLSCRFEDVLAAQSRGFLFDDCRNCVELGAGRCSGGCAALRLAGRVGCGVIASQPVSRPARYADNGVRPRAPTFEQGES